MHRKKSTNTFIRKRIHVENRSSTNVYAVMTEYLQVLLIAILVLFIYSNALEGSFIFDDLPNIQYNPHIRLTELTLEGLTKAGLESHASRRPVANISFALNYYFHQYNVLGYHLVNILIHVAAGILLFLLAKTTLSILSLHSPYETDSWIPFFTACLWLVHPIQTQSVGYIVQRMNSMAAMFYVLSVLLYARGRLTEDKRKKWVLFAGCTLAGMLALGSKEIAATLPFFIFLYEWYFFQELRWAWLKRHFLGFAAVLILLALAAFMYVGGHPLERILSGYEGDDFTLTQRVMTEFRVVVFYISLLMFPHPSRLNLDYDFLLSHSLFEPLTTLLSIVAITSLIGLAFCTAKKEPLGSFGILWFLGNLLIESSVIGLEVVYQHRTYLPSMLVSLTVVSMAYRYAKPKWLRLAVLCAVVMVCCVWTYERNTVWNDDVALWQDCVEKSPNKARPYYNLGVSLGKRGKLNEAIAYYSKALRINPNITEAHYNLGLALAKQGRLKEAIGHYSQALRIEPSYVSARVNLGYTLVEQGQLKEGIAHLTRAVQINPDHAEAHNNLGLALAKQGRLKEAVGHYSQALEIRPHFAEVHYNLGNALARQGKFEEAVKCYSEALMIRPGYSLARRNLKTARHMLGSPPLNSGVE